MLSRSAVLTMRKATNAFKQVFVCNDCSCPLPKEMCQSYLRNTNQSTYDEVVAEEKLQKAMQEYERKNNNSKDEKYDSPEQIEEYRMASRKQIILRNRIEDSYVRKAFTGLLRMDQFVPEDIPKGSNLLASLQKYLQKHVEYAESQGQYRSAENIYKVSEQLANFELQAKSIDELLIEILEALNFRRNRSNRFAMEKRMLMSLEEDLTRYTNFKWRRLKF